MTTKLSSQSAEDHCQKQVQFTRRRLRSASDILAATWAARNTDPDRARIWIDILRLALVLMVILFPAAAYGKSRTVHVGVYQNTPKIFMDENGKASGIFIELLQEIADQEGWKLDYVACDWADCLLALEDGRIDLMPDVAYSSERDLKYDFHEIPLLESWSIIYSSPGIRINRLSELSGKRVAVLNNSIQQTDFQRMMSGFGYDATTVPVDSLDQAFAMAADGSVDAAIANHFFGDYYYQEYGLIKTTIVFDAVTLYYATAEGRNHDLLDAVDVAMIKWLQEPESIYFKTISRWMEKEPSYKIPQVVFWVIGGVSGLLVLAAGMIILLRKQVEIRTLHLQQASAELQKSEERYQILARISPVGIFRTELDGATSYVNPKWCEISGLSPEEAMGDGWLKAVHPDDKERLSKQWEQSTQIHEASYNDYRFMRQDGTVVWVMGQAVPEVDSQNQVIGYVGTITDITGRVCAETELRRLNVELEERVALRTEELVVAMNKALEADRLKSAFLASMSHELRTPLNSIIGFVGVILQGMAGPLNAEQTKQLGMVRSSARHLLALINDVLDISKIEAGQLEVVCAPFDMRTVIENALRTVSPLAQKKGLALIAAIGSNVSTVISDQRRVEQILLNLLSNAIKFTERGEVRLECRVADHHLETRVCDTGIGIRPEDLGKLFNPFHQLETGLNRRHEGTGLGLAIGKNLVCLLGGQIKAESEWGMGSTFTFSLPLTPEGEPHGKYPAD